VHRLHRAQAKLASKAPFSQYGELEKMGATISWGSPTDPATWPQGEFEVVYDNNGKDMASCKPLIDAHVVRADCKRKCGWHPSFSARDAPHKLYLLL
jgi:hypothetical protein